MFEDFFNSENFDPKKGMNFKKITDMLNNMFNPSNPPTKIQEYEINGKWRIEKIWENEDGSQFVSATEIPMDEHLNNPSISESFKSESFMDTFSITETTDKLDIKDLEKQLDKAVKIEDYERAAKIRDQIEQIKNPSVSEEDELWNI
jgi:excinuclease UvrABC helicase subunit UvrB